MDDQKNQRMKYPCIIIFILLFNIGSHGQVQLKLNTTDNKTTIIRHIYGHFAEHLGRCIYDGFWVGDSIKVAKHDRIRLDLVEALKKIKVPNLRWPGGCFADEYHWRDGIGPRNQRPKNGEYQLGWRYGRQQFWNP